MESKKTQELALLIRRICWAKGYEKEWLYKIGKELDIPYFAKFTHNYYETYQGYTHYSKMSEDEAAIEIAKHLTDAKLIELLNRLTISKEVYFYGKYYSLENATLTFIDSTDKVRQRVREAVGKWGDKAYHVLNALLELDVTDFAGIVRKLGEYGISYQPSAMLSKLEGLRLVMTVYKSRQYHDYMMPPEIKPAVKEELESYGKIIVPIETKIVAAELQEVLSTEEEFNGYLKRLVGDRLEQTVDFGKQFSALYLARYLQELFGSLLSFDSFLTIVQQYSLCDAEVVSEKGRTAMKTGFNLALFGEPGTGKTFSTHDMILGKPERGIPAHGLPGRNRYCGGMTPAKFIEVGQAYEGRRFNFIVTEFNDWFKSKGMVEPLKLAMERGTIVRETKSYTIGPYKFDSFFSVNYNVEAYGRGYEVTVSDPNFNAIEDRMLCRLHTLTKERYIEIGEKQMQLALGLISMDKAQAIRDHLTLVHAIQTRHPLVSEQFHYKPILLTKEIFDEIRKARQAILKNLTSEKLAFSPRLEMRGVQLACAMSLLRYFQSTKDYIEIDPEAIHVAVQFYVEEASVRSKEEFNPQEVLGEISGRYTQTISSKELNHR